jgi:hypothetical protein
MILDTLLKFRMLNTVVHKVKNEAVPGYTVYVCVCMYIYIYTYTHTQRFIMFSVITNIYNKKTKGPTLMELFTATGKLKKF